MAPPHGTPELQAELAKIAKAIVHEGRGILAADESTGKLLSLELRFIYCQVRLESDLLRLIVKIMKKIE